MWFFYVPLVAAVLVALGSLVVGVVPVTITAALIAVLILGLIVAGRARSLRIDSVEAPSGIPGSREASYEARVDPQSTPPGGSTGT
jgi:hypothetical protein